MLPRREPIDVPGAGEVEAILDGASEPRALLALAHGAGAPMRHPFLGALAHALARNGISTMRYAFPYAQRRAGRPDPPAVLVATVRAALDRAAGLAGGLPLLAGGKSLGGRMSSTALAGGNPSGVRGLIFVGFPLHPAGRPSDGRAAHLDDVDVPMLFLQGTRDALADLALVRGVCGRLGTRATLHVVEDADHGFHVPKRSGRTDAEVIEELAGTVSLWLDRVLATAPHPPA